MTKIKKIGKVKLKKIVEKSTSLTDVLRQIGFKAHGSNYNTLKKALNEYKIDYSHIRLGPKQNLGRKFPSPSNTIDLKDILVEKSYYPSGRLRLRLIKEGILKNECAECELQQFWNNKPLTLTLDHINGIGTDNRIVNLRILCPNCHSQTDTFAGRNLRKIENGVRVNAKRIFKKIKCKECDSLIFIRNKTGLCKKCYNINKRKVKKRPSFEEVKKYGYSKIGIKYGVSANAVKKWFKGV